jgi:hypothetical protein
MEGVAGKPSPSLAAPPPLGSLWYDFAKNMGIAVVSSITGAITTFLVTKLWKCIKPNYPSVTHLQIMRHLHPATRRFNTQFHPSQGAALQQARQSTQLLRPPLHLVNVVISNVVCYETAREMVLPLKQPQLLYKLTLLLSSL